jgi:hypothetical protein
MLLINIHKLDIILAYPITIGALEDKIDNIGSIFGLESEDIVALSRPKDLLKGGEVDAEGDVAVAAEGGEAFGFEHHGDEGDVRVVHGLESDAGVIAIKVAVLDEILDGVNHLLEPDPTVSLWAMLECGQYYKSACSRRASSILNVQSGVGWNAVGEDAL